MEIHQWPFLDFDLMNINTHCWRCFEPSKMIHGWWIYNSWGTKGILGYTRYTSTFHINEAAIINNNHHLDHSTIWPSNNRGVYHGNWGAKTEKSRSLGQVQELKTASKGVVSLNFGHGSWFLVHRVRSAFWVGFFHFAWEEHGKPVNPNVF